MKNKKLLYTLAIGTVILFSLGWLLLYRAFFVNNYEGLFFAAFLYLCAFGFFYFLVVLEHNRRILHLVCSFGMMGAVFLGKDHLMPSFLVWAVIMASCVVAIERIKTEQYNRINIDIYRILKRGVPVIGTAFTLLVAAGFYFSVANLQKVGHVPRINIKISTETTRIAFKIVDIVMPNDEISWVLEGVTVDEYFRKILRSQDISLEGTVLEEIRNEVDDEIRAQREAGIEREVWERERMIVEKNRAMLADKLQIELDGNERIDDVLNNLINKRANDLINGQVIVSEMLPIGSAVALFVSIRSIVWISNVILFWTISGIFSILVKLGKIKVVKEVREIENIEI